MLSLGKPQEIDRTAREIVSVFSAEIPHLSSYRGARISCGGDYADNTHTADDLKKLIGKLRVLREAKDRELYGSYGFETITEHIHLLEDALEAGEKDDELKAVYKRIDHIYANVYDSYTDGLSAYLSGDDSPSDEQTILRIEKLRHFRDVELRELRVAEARAANVNVSARSESTATASAAVELSVAIERIDNLPESSLTDDEKITLKAMMADLQTKDAKKREGKLQKVLGWLANKGTDVFIAAMPYIVQAVQSQM